MRTGQMAEFLGRSKDWLKQRKGTVFKEGVHYYQKPGDSEPFWDVGAMVEWVRNGDRSEAAKEVLETVLQ
jgi:hypothetical protein